MRHLLPLTLVLALLGGCSVAGVQSGGWQGPPWECAPIDLHWQELPANPCFRAVLTAEHKVTLQWRIIDSQQMVYIYDDHGANYVDVGFKKAICPAAPFNTCSTTITVTEGGYQRWVLKVEGANGGQVNVPASIVVPTPYRLADVTGGGFIDMLAPTSQTIAWKVDRRNAAFDQPAQQGRVKIIPPGAWFQGAPTRYPRSGAQANLTIPESAVSAPGQKVYTLSDCHIPLGSDREFCSPGVAVDFYTGADRFLDWNPVYAESGKDLTVAFTSRSGDVRRLSSKTLIPPHSGGTLLETTAGRITIDARLLTPGTHDLELVSCISLTNTCSPPEKLRILVDSNMDWTLGRDYADDFRTGVGHAVLGFGDPLDITYDSNGGIWLINEFANNIEHVSPAGTVASFTLPTARQAVVKDFVLEPVKPFSSSLGKNISSVNFSALGERATRIGARLWFTQGGEMQGPPTKLKNHSRVISFDPSLSDSLATPYDDRLCAYNVPPEYENQPANNQVIGLAGTSDRIWIGESRTFFGPGPTAISSFIPDPNSCENLLNFEDPQALARQKLPYCTPGKTPEQDGCMELILLDGPLSTLRVGHLEMDPVDNTVWFTDSHGRFLGHLDPDHVKDVVVYPLPDPHTELWFFGGFPWSLRVDDEAVYFGEYKSGDILRFDKATATFDEIQIPVATNQVKLHSIDIDAATNRLWFTLANETLVPLDRAASTIGYIDLASWRAHVAQPKIYTQISGVIYSGLDTIPPSSAEPDQHQSFRGIAVDPASGKIALASMRRRQIIELTPNTSFWP